MDSLHLHLLFTASASRERIQELTCVDVNGIEAEASIAPPTEIDRTGGVGATSNDE
uniref:Uncharacterized protein n=1 Tax=Oryza barthii TaxID=65489 RepID=A0A0D3H0U8_9ORYZ